MLSADMIFDGYRLVRPIGRGGFGEVWLCNSEAVGGYHALKFVAVNRSEIFEKEYDALTRYRRFASRLRSANIMPIEHINRVTEGIFYVMPLADGTHAKSPDDNSWQADTLASRIEAHRAAGTWFSSDEILKTFLPVLNALQSLSDNGLVHRDVKPENILYVAGQACLSDISLLGEDKNSLTRCGTPGYMTPSWYSGGHADMFGAALTLYTLLTGNDPDKFGRANHRWPPSGKSSLSPAEQREWERIHRIVHRALEEKTSERYLNFTAFRRALEKSPSGKKQTAPALFVRRALTVTGFAATVACAFLVFERFQNSVAPENVVAAEIKIASPTKGRLSIAAYDDIFSASKKIRKEFDTHITTLIEKGEPVTEVTPLFSLAKEFLANRESVESTSGDGLSPAVINQTVSCLELAFFRMHEHLFAEAQARPNTPEEKTFFEKNIAPSLAQQLRQDMPTFPLQTEFVFDAKNKMMQRDGYADLLASAQTVTDSEKLAVIKNEAESRAKTDFEKWYFAWQIEPSLLAKN